MEINERYRLGMIPARQIKRLPGIQLDTSQKKVERVKDFSKKRGYYKPIILSGDMSLLSGAATFDACLENKETKIPAVIVKTEGDADNLFFALQSTALDEAPNAVAVSAAIVRLIDLHGVPRKDIAKTLGRSPSWINRMENIGRRLNREVQKLVIEGQVPSRSAQEIARLPDSVQTAFAVCACNEFLSRRNIAYLVNRYLNVDTADEERDRIIHTPWLALPNELKRHSPKCRDNSDSARLSRAIARCMDAAAFLSKFLDRTDISETAVRMSDITALADVLSALRLRLQAVFAPGKNNGAGEV